MDDPLIKQLLDGQHALFKKVDQINETLVKLARIEERQVNDRDAISRLGADLRVNKSNCSDKIDKIDIVLEDLKKRILTVENVTGNRGAFFKWVQSIITPLIVSGLALWFLK